MQTDIQIHYKGLFSEPIVYKNVRQHSIENNNDSLIVKFYYTPRNKKERYYEFNIPKENILSLGVRRTE